MLLCAVNMHLAFAGIFGAMLVRIFEVADFAAVIVLLIVNGSLEGNGGIVGHHFYIVMHQSTVNVDVVLLSHFLHSAFIPLTDNASLLLWRFAAASVA